MNTNDVRMREQCHVEIKQELDKLMDRYATEVAKNITDDELRELLQIPKDSNVNVNDVLNALFVHNDAALNLIGDAKISRRSDTSADDLVQIAALSLDMQRKL